MPLQDLINKIGHRVMFGTKQKEVDKCLRTATPATVLHDLHSCLVQDQSVANTPAIFDACCVQDSPQGQPFWTKESLENHIVKTHPGATIPDASIDVLWSCFYFYAYHPFPRYDADHQKLDRPAFERAISLLAFHRTEILGTLGDGIGYWRISRQQNQHTSNPSLSIDDDMMDVLAMTKPNIEKGFPSSDQLTPAVQRLLKGANPSYKLHLNDLATLLGLFSRMRVHKLTWGQGFYYASFEESSPQKEELVKILLQPFRLDQEGFLTPDSMIRGLDILPNLEQHLHQLWAAIFQPPMPEASVAFGTASQPNSTTSDILRAVSLFVPPYEAHKKSEIARKFRPFSFEEICEPSTQRSNDNLSRNHIIQRVAQEETDHRPRLLLFVGDQDQSRIPEVTGALFSRTSGTMSTKNQAIPEETGERSLDLPQLLFQLQPSFRLIQLNKAGNTRPPAHESTTGHVDNLGAQYWIGDRESKVGLRVDTVTSQVTYLQNTATADKSRNLYDEVFWNNENVSGKKQDEGIEKSFAVTQIAVYRVEDGEAIASDKRGIDGPQSRKKVYRVIEKGEGSGLEIPTSGLT
ncbi:hypothetical protein N7510_005918 [Penicillium lagena]|uniref:uncharacterized protein n=1 Tax=Penicillium lagena TaxID=94218 RepID=UPI002541B261|nr:uncharacterized protein N7510_005918 [Penicillium lagena]KAJ5612724.1 hypothetical protein N7510_005918 [Penicillium lagena]